LLGVKSHQFPHNHYSKLNISVEAPRVERAPPRQWPSPGRERTQKCAWARHREGAGGAVAAAEHWGSAEGRGGARATGRGGSRIGSASEAGARESEGEACGRIDARGAPRNLAAAVAAAAVVIFRAASASARLRQRSVLRGP